MFRRNPSKRSPLKHVPSRQPGQSLEDLFDRYAITKLGFWITVPLVGWGLAAADWLRWYRQAPPEPVMNSVFALILTIVAVIRLWRLFPQLHAIRQGIDGERYVGQQLEDLRQRGFRVIHDLCGDNFNIDHVIIGPEGVFTIETKTISKPARGNIKIEYDGNSITVPECKLDRDPIVQAKAAASYIRRILKETTSRDVDVQPVVIFPGWYVQKNARRVEVWVLNEGQLDAYLDHEDLKLSPEDIALYASRLAENASRFA